MITRTLVKLAGVSLALGLLAASAARADRGPMPLGDLIAGANRILIGSVVDVADTTVPGEHVATVNVEENLFGTGPGSIALLGQRNDPDRPQFFEGSRILAFLISTPTGKLFPVGKDQGIMLLGDASLASARNLVNTALLMGSALRLADVRLDLLLDQSPPPPLLGTLFAELGKGVSGADAPDILEIACRPAAYVSHAATFAVRQVGALALPDGQPCLDRIVRSPADRGLAILAVDAMGDLGDPASVPLLLSLLPNLPIPPRLVLRDDEPPGQVGPPDDPEDDTNPVPDPGEDDDQIPPPAVEPEIPVGPGDEPFDGTPDDDGQDDPSTFDDPEGDDPQAGDDLVHRGVDGGLSLAAVLALGKIGDPAALSTLARVAREGDDLALHSTVVRALGLLGDIALQPLNNIKRTHPNILVRQLADQTIRRLQG